MMAPAHALTGITAATLTATLGRLTGNPLDPATTALLAALLAGAALLPDLDTERSTAATAFGPPGRALSRATARASAAVHHATATARDRDRDGAHRGLTHTAAFALLLGASVAAVTFTLDRVAAHAVTFALLTLAVRALAPRAGRPAALAVAALGTLLAADVPHPDTRWALLGGAVTAGCLLHAWGDSLTWAGCPWLWPLRIGGRRWYPVRPPHGTRFETGGTIERRVVTPLLALAALIGASATLLP